MESALVPTLIETVKVASSVKYEGDSLRRIFLAQL